MSRPVREYRRSSADSIGDAMFRMLARLGVGPADLLITRGRKTGLPRSNPVVVVRHEGRQWLVAPYGAVPWVLNARAAGRVTLRRGRARCDYTVRELQPDEAGPVLKRYITVATATRPYFQADKDAPVADFVAEAPGHPVFKLGPAEDERR
ncbi:hypothetical protein GCM10009733_059930 [Nonomuraea maheshkhaliensis]|uniref:Nitroreductase family deazaflavin-dependent oxidoreductase n=1 Tax=Nonomuraea maheshkhaliensis TaxID=419590 RepID=A0ABN2FN44_9ACTN